VDVEVLAERFVAGRQRQPEAQLGMRGEPLAVRHRDGGSSQCPLPEACDVTMAGEADLPQLREPDAVPVACGRSLDGCAHRTNTSWPVPCEPPAGGVADATMCSTPYPVHAPQS